MALQRVNLLFNKLKISQKCGIWQEPRLPHEAYAAAVLFQQRTRLPKIQKQNEKKWSMVALKSNYISLKICTFQRLTSSQLGWSKFSPRPTTADLQIANRPSNTIIFPGARGWTKTLTLSQAVVNSPQDQHWKTTRWARTSSLVRSRDMGPLKLAL